jgi:hypothetical protein
MKNKISLIVFLWLINSYGTPHGETYFHGVQTSYVAHLASCLVGTRM